VSFPFDLHSAAVFDSHMPCCSPAMPPTCSSESDLSRPRQIRGRVAAGKWHGMCELASAAQRRHVGDLPTFGTVGEWQGSGRVVAWERHGMCELAFNAARERHGICESHLKFCFMQVHMKRVSDSDNTYGWEI
jgi:hypothetical protein